MIVPGEFVVECYAKVFCIFGWLYLGVVDCVSVCGGFLFGSDGEELAFVGMKLHRPFFLPFTQACEVLLEYLMIKT